MAVSNQGANRSGLRSPLVTRILIGVILLTVIGLVLLGNWQLRRLEWKLALIERIESRVSATPVIAPSVADWPAISRDKDEYRRITIQGHFLHGQETLVWAITEHGNGYWVITPLETASAETVLINRGFVPVDASDQAQRHSGLINGEVTVTGLLRLTEPVGIALRDNKPAEDRWYSRDVQAIAQARGLHNTAPYFIDADGHANPGDLPIGGLTQLTFRNPHLVYALTWYGLALLLIGMTLRVVWLERKGPIADD